MFNNTIQWTEEVPVIADHIEHTEEVLTTTEGTISLEISHKDLAAAILDFCQEEITSKKILMDIVKISPEDNSSELLDTKRLQEGNIR